jgi:hypothetical protein
MFIKITSNSLPLENFCCEPTREIARAVFSGFAGRFCSVRITPYTHTERLWSFGFWSQTHFDDIQWL